MRVIRKQKERKNGRKIWRGT